MGTDAGCARPEWVLVMDTSVLLCYFEHLGYYMLSGQCQHQRMDEFKKMVCEGRRKIILSVCSKQIDDKFGESYPEVFGQGDEAWKGSRNKGRRKKQLEVKDTDPEEVLGSLHQALRDDFEPFKIKITKESRKQTRDGVYDYLRQVYLDRPTSAEAESWIYSKRHYLPNFAHGVTDKHRAEDRNRQKIRRLIKSMKKGGDLDMLVQTQLLVENNPDTNALFVSADSDHMKCKPHLLKETDGRVQVKFPVEAIKWASE